jgi:hypothetical protein
MGKEADRHIRADPPMGGGVYFLTFLRFLEVFACAGCAWA